MTDQESRGAVSAHSGELLRHTRALYRFFTESDYMLRAGQEDICDFVAGNPQEMPLPEFVEALQRWAVPRRRDWFAYEPGEAAAKAAVAASVSERVGLGFEEDDIFLTNGAFGGLAVTLRALADRGDEVIFLSPPWFFYELMIRSMGAEPVRVWLEPPRFELDPSAIAAAITPKTRAVILNSPHNPTGRIYGPAELGEVATVLAEAGDRAGRPIYLISDEAYSRILFDGNTFTSPATLYPRTVLVYTYGKTLLTPGQRIGYLALPPGMPDRDELSDAILINQLAMGWVFPNGLLQHALPDIDRLSIDVGALERRRDRVVEALRSMGYQLESPQGTFYLLPRSPIADDQAFTDHLASQDVFVLPGELVELPGWFRISLTANDEMVDRALPVFERAIKELSGSGA